MQGVIEGHGEKGKAKDLTSGVSSLFPSSPAAFSPSMPFGFSMNFKGNPEKKQCYGVPLKSILNS